MEYKYFPEKINNDNKRPGMPKEGWMVRYNFHPDYGTLSMRCFETLYDAEEFIDSLINGE